ncbi:hypothetical protein P3T76_015366 [Phytophthora citrophthora]|uniref:Uncharacterized protein n=1 Tax=Phytophthora citrophthora TaxID=4793 RepID=A0AAD9FZD0_9STRA|nr:hypothetical protein P3T76_015366 [Phytophthora citrophthora]
MTNESSDSCVREVEVPETPRQLLGDAFKQVEIDAEILFQSVEGPSAIDETFLGQTTAWIDDCVVVKGGQSPLSPSDPCDVEKSIPLFSPQDRAMESCAQGPLLLKRSITLAECGHSAKKAKLL